MLTKKNSKTNVKIIVQPHLSVVFSRRAQRSEVLRVTENRTTDFYDKDPKVIKKMLTPVGHILL